MESNNGFPTPKCSSRVVRSSPLPQLSWGDPYEIWESMLTKDEIYNRDPNLLDRHPNITARMRSILLDWLSEVCEAFNLLRETYYFALDFVDRYLSIKNDVPRQKLQLLGISCLFIAAKIEEVVPPKLSDMAFVTDGTCSVLEIIEMELVVMESLNWTLHPVTVNKWLCVYMQLYSIIEKENAPLEEHHVTGDGFLRPNYSTVFFYQISHLVDLCMLDIGSLEYSYDVIAAAAFYHFTSEDTVYKCTRLKITDIWECVRWITPFALAVRESGYNVREPKVGSGSESWSDLQYHIATLKLLEMAHLNQIDLKEDSNEETSAPPSPLSSPSTSQVKRPRKRKCDVNNNESKKKRKVSDSSKFA